jgi:hypothetical protein
MPSPLHGNRLVTFALMFPGNAKKTLLESACCNGAFSDLRARASDRPNTCRSVHNWRFSENLRGLSTPANPSIGAASRVFPPDAAKL